MNKRIIATAILFCMLFGAIAPTAQAVGEALQPYSVQNGVLEYKVSRINGRFTVQTADGQPGKQSDNDLDLLFMRDELPDTSFTTLRIDGQDYIFGNDYGQDGGIVSETLVNGLTAKTLWRVKDVEVTQTLQLITDLSNPDVGYVRVSYQVANGSASPVNLGARILLDTQLGQNDAAPMLIGTSYITNETEYSGEHLPVTWKSVDQQFASNVIAYGQLSGWGNLAPERFVVAHWEAISATKWDYQVDPLRNFTTNKNSYRSADSAVAMYYQPSRLDTGATRTYETFYGIGSLYDSANQADFTIQLNSPQKLTVNSSGTGYQESSFQITVSIDNSGEACVDQRNLKVELGLSDELEIAAGEAEVKTISLLKKGDSGSVSFQVVPRVVQQLAVAEYGVTITYGADQYVEASKYVILPSIKGEVPHMQMTEVAPGTLYTRAAKKSLVIKGSAFDSLKADNEWTMSITNVRTGKAEEIFRKDIYITDSSLSVQIDDSLQFEAGEHEVGIRSQNYGNLSRKFDFTDDPEFDRVEYGVLLIGDFSGDNVYDVKLLESEELIANLSAEERAAILLTIRGQVSTYELDGITYYDCASGSIINNAVMYTAPLSKPQSAMTICRYDGRTEGWSKFADFDWFGDQQHSLVISGDGHLSVGDYYFHYGRFYVTLVDGNEYVLAEVGDGNNIDLNPDVGEVPADESSPVTIVTPANVIANEAFKLTGALTGMKINISDAIIGQETVSLGGSVSLALPWMQLGDDDDDGGGTSQPESKHPGFEKIDKANDVLGADSLVELNLEELRYGVNANDNSADLVGIKAAGGINLTDDALPLLKAGGAKAAFAIDSINYDGYYTMMEAGVKVGEVFECSAKVALVFETGGSCIPDAIELVLGGEVMKIPLGAGAFSVGWLTKLGGGVYNLYDTIRGNYNLIPPFSMKLITGYADPTTVALELETISMEVGIGKIRFEAEEGKIVKLPLLEKMYAGFMIYGTEVDGVVYPCVDISAGIDLNLLDIIKGSGSIWLVADPRIESIFGNLSAGGKVYAGIFIPSFIPVVGGLELAAIMAELSTYRVYAGIRVIGIPLSIGYYWADKKVKFNDAWGFDDYQEAFNIPRDELENALAIQYAESGTNADGVMLFGSNLRVTYRSDDVPTPFGVDTKLHQIAVQDQDYSLFEVQYDGALPLITVTDPVGNVYSLVENENYRLQTIPAAESQSGVEEHYAYISVVDPMDGTWTIETDVPTTVTGMDVLELPEVQVKNFTHSGGSLTANWEAKSIADGYTVDVHLSQVQPMMAACSAEQLSVMSEAELADYYRAQSDNHDVGICIADGLDAASGAATLSIPERVLDGEYQVRVVLKDASGASVSSALSEQSFSYTNPNTPTTVRDLSLQAAGDGQFQLTFAAADRADGYLVEILDEQGQPIDGLAQTTTDTSLYIGNTYQAAIGYDAQGNPTGFQEVGTFPGNRYRARVTAYAERNLVQYQSAPVTSEAVYLPVPSPAQLTLRVNNLTPTAADGASEVTVNSSTANVAVTSDQNGKLIYGLDGVFSDQTLSVTAGVPENISLALEEGGSTLNCYFVNEQGDYTTEKLCVSVDTVAPTLMLDQTVVESQRGTYSITGTAETGAAVYVNGQHAAVQNGKFSYVGSDNASRQSVSVQALDWAGNQTRMYCDVVPSEMSRLVSLSVHANGTTIDAEEVLQLERDDSLQLTVYGQAEDGSKYLLDSSNVSFSVVFGEGKVSVDQAGRLTAESHGDAVVMCEYAVTKDYWLEQAVALQVVSPTAEPDTIRVFSTELAAELLVGEVVTALSVPNAPADRLYSYTVSDNDYLQVRDNQLLLKAPPVGVTEFDVTLTAQGHAFQAGQYVDVGDQIVKQITFRVTQRVASISALPSLQVETGVDFHRLALPEKVEVTLADGSRHSYPVTWSKGAYNSTVPRVYILRGEVAVAPGVVNPGNLVAQVQVSVYRPSSEDEEPAEDIALDGVIPTERLTVSRRTSDSSDAQLVTDTVTISDTLWQATVKRALSKQQSVVVMLPAVGEATDPTTTSDGRPIVRETKLTLADGQVDALARTKLIVCGSDGTEIELPPALLDSLGRENAGLELTVSQVSLAQAQREVAAAGQAIAGQEIATNFRGWTGLRFPAPEGVPATELRVHVRHSDGSAEDLVPEVITGADGRKYLEINVDRFSTFVVYRAVTTQQISLTIGRKVARIAGQDHSLEAAPYVQPGSNRTMVPIRLISEGLGAKVEWLAHGKQVRITDGSLVILLTVGSRIVKVNGQDMASDVAPEVVSDRTFVPLRLISEILGARVDYDGPSKTVTIRAR